MQSDTTFTMTRRGDRLAITFNSTLDNVDKACGHALEFLHQKISDFEHDFEINLLMREGLMNAVKHGNAFALDKLVHFSIRACPPDAILMEIEDQGEGFKWQKKGYDLPENFAESGRGIFIIRQYCSLVKYNAKGNHLTIHKQLTVE
ncbi:serine/threonine-protein kinase RsbW [Desulfocicer vacuolatum DSM 3385]|uniref:Serine/threonine-protein kinase RsbW n=1 Tax=Desulfocicer vacuolatum DSM 3385 TaxID=1121400 RepID=A0A1W1YPR6_9BACT|nr:ATP-binding protein [Desulfocicer vacuolatum]SMC37801.1 serine/threonine-protein kinase RsbW [Desulfocicer vacuolatum DSM 3385]